MVNTISPKRGSLADISPTAERRVSLFRVFSGKDSEASDHEDDRGARSFDGIALTDIPRKDTAESVPQTPRARTSEEKPRRETPFLLRRLDHHDSEQLEGDDLRMYSKTTSQISHTYVTFRDAEVENEYQMVYVSKMGGKFVSAILIVLLSTSTQAGVIIAVSQTPFVRTLPNLPLFFFFSQPPSPPFL